MDKVNYSDYKLLDVDYYKNFLSESEATKLLNTLLQSSDLKLKPNTRTNCTYGDKGVFYSVTFYGKTVVRHAKEWLPQLKDIRDRLEKLTGQKYNYVVVQHYPHGSVGIKPHRDKEMASNTIIAGISLGAKRKLIMSRQGLNTKIDLEHGSLYTFNPPTNDYWTHSIDPDRHVVHPRISLTFRLK